MGEAARRSHEQACRALEERFGYPEMPAPYVCGLPPIDREHALVIAQHRRCIDAAASRDRRWFTEELGRYLVMIEAHYRSEEMLQREVGFPERGEHALVHRHFLRSLEAMLDELRRSGPGPAVTAWMAEGSPHWLGVHIHNDMAIARYCRERKLPPEQLDRVWRAGVPAIDEPVAPLDWPAQL